MNQYGTLAKKHWKMYRPSEYQALTDPETFFTELGNQVDDQVQAIQLETEAQERPTLNAMDYLARVGRLNAIRTQAQELVMADLVFLPTDLQTTDTPWLEDSESLDVDVSLEDRLGRLGAVLVEDGNVLPTNRAHEVWPLFVAAWEESGTPEQMEAFKVAWRAWVRSVPGLAEALPA